MKNYIEYYFDENGRFSADIHKEGRCRVVKNEKNLYKLLEISQKHGYNVNREGIIRKRAKQITKEFDKYMKRKQRLKSAKFRGSNFLIISAVKYKEFPDNPKSIYYVTALI